VVAVMLGNLAVGVGETGPFLSLEQVLVAQATPGARLTWQMSLYNVVGYAASGLGALSVTLLAGRGDEGYAPLFWIFAAGGVAQMLLYARLEPAVGGASAARGAGASGTAATSAAPMPSRGFIYRLAALFALDSLAGGFVVQSLIAYWFFSHFGLPLSALGLVFFGSQLMTVVSLLIAAPVAARLGLVETMVFSHLLSNFLLIGMAFAPDARVAIVLLLARHLLSQIDVPTRQAFLMQVVEPHERAGAATLTNAARTVAQAVSPVLTGHVMQAAGMGAPFLLGGTLKIVYDLLLYRLARGQTSKPEQLTATR
jgi:Na+/melibiose symporter-like transporter